MIFKNPKGTRDLVGVNYDKYMELCDIIEKRFKQFGGIGMKTPTFECRDVLMKKYGEGAEKEMFMVEFGLNNDDLDNKKEALALRYDQTVPFARYLIQNKINKMRRYQIGSVYRIDTPNLKDNRLREFTQADFDFAGEAPYEPELDILKMINFIMSDLGIDNYRIEYNFRQNLYGMFRACGVDDDQLLYVSRTLDALDKITWKGIESKLGIDLTNKLKDKIDTGFVDDSFKSDLTYFQQIMDWSSIQKCQFKPNLARGLDYYTGFIFEVFIDGFSSAVAAGGRYDNLIKTMTDTKIVSNLIGFSLGLERLLPFAKNCDKVGNKNIKIYVISLGESEELSNTKMKIINDIRTSFPNFQLGYMIKDKKMGKQLKICLDEGYQYMILLGENEFAQGNCKIKDITTQTQTLLPIPDIKNYLINLTNNPIT
jgi:histidyl-tRNA synthetase